MHFEMFVRQPHGNQPQPQPPTERRHLFQRGLEPAPLAARRGDIDRVGDRLPRDALVDQRQREPGLEFHDYRRLARAAGDDIGRADLGLHVIALAFEKGFYGGIKLGFLHGALHLLHKNLRPASPG